MSVVRAAGGVVWRRGPGGIEIVVIHRPRYDDWSLPKGKVDPGETDEAAAIREVAEEASVAATLGPELAGASYVDRNGRDKVVRYWAMTVRSGHVDADNEVDEAEWLPIGEARLRLSYSRDADVVDSARGLLAPLAKLAVLGVDHIVVISGDVEGSLRWWTQMLGLAGERVGQWRRGEAPFPSVRVDASTIIDLLAGEVSGANVDHLCLEVTGVDVAWLTGSGLFEVLDGPALRWGARGEATSVYVRSPEGLTVELRSY